jgi:uncharacterized protein YchJ
MGTITHSETNSKRETGFVSFSSQFHQPRGSLSASKNFHRAEERYVYLDVIVGAVLSSRERERECCANYKAFMVPAPVNAPAQRFLGLSGAPTLGCTVHS